MVHTSELVHTKGPHPDGRVNGTTTRQHVLEGGQMTRPDIGAGTRDRPAPLQRRKRLLARLATEEFDVLVIGGGVTGCGAALDAAMDGCADLLR